MVSAASSSYAHGHKFESCHLTPDLDVTKEGVEFRLTRSYDPKRITSVPQSSKVEPPHVPRTRTTEAIIIGKITD